MNPKAFFKNKKNIVLVSILAVGLIVLVYLFKDSLISVVNVPPEAEISFSIPRKRIDIDYNVLKSPVIKDLDPYEDIPPYTGEVGRDNPFVTNK